LIEFEQFKIVEAPFMENVAGIPQISPTEVKARLDRGDEVFLLDVREPHERDICTIGGELIPKDSVAKNISLIPRAKEVIVYCRSGGRSQWVAQELKSKHGFERVLNMAGGVLRWADEVDPSVQKY
jgi:adenylyltransferase/sulfurtransferase